MSEKIFVNDLNIVSGKSGSVGKLIFPYSGEEPFYIELKPSCGCIRVKWEKGVGITGTILVEAARNKAHIPHERWYVIRYNLTRTDGSFSGMVDVQVQVNK